MMTAVSSQHSFLSSNSLEKLFAARSGSLLQMLDLGSKYHFPLMHGVGSGVGSGVGLRVGSLGIKLSSPMSFVGEYVGIDSVGARLSLPGGNVGLGVGLGVGSSVGAGVGFGVGFGVGSSVGAGVGLGVGSSVGSAVGLGVGSGVGSSVGSLVGPGVGSGVPRGAGSIMSSQISNAGQPSPASPQVLSQHSLRSLYTTLV
mmetsp:Transcript_2731/g.6856  ORF Transcript_2731/g.6856 Transcript_2731/m.6856 type:complete len:200 (-) Transcript_2731:3315-3914(-)